MCPASPGGGRTQSVAGAAALLAGPPAVITAGIDLLAESPRAQAVNVTTVDFRPPDLPSADSVDVLGALTTVLLDPRIAAANALAAERMLAVRAHLVDVRPAGTALGLRPGEFCHQSACACGIVGEFEQATSTAAAPPSALIMGPSPRHADDTPKIAGSSP